MKDEIQHIRELFAEWRKAHNEATGISSGCGCTPFYAEADRKKRALLNAMMLAYASYPDEIRQFEKEHCSHITGWKSPYVADAHTKETP
jgi:hypothetical protein